MIHERLCDEQWGGKADVTQIYAEMNAIAPAHAAAELLRKARTGRRSKRVPSLLRHT